MERGKRYRVKGRRVEWKQGRERVRKGGGGVKERVVREFSFVLFNLLENSKLTKINK